MGWFCKKFPNLRREDVLIEAVRLASRAEELHDPKIGAFWTLCEYRLRELNRFVESEFSSRQIPLRKVLSKEDLEARKTIERRGGIGGDDPRPVDFSGMGNGARVTARRRPTSSSRLALAVRSGFLRSLTGTA